ncbi:chromate resistance protein ChrB domain-containing protein [Janibacter indicus]|uniref:chromate resistance protein ChrB domain-containing protein n=1 Tax=Janibacter indicus TaxID=857417 RepID=UPI003D9A8154
MKWVTREGLHIDRASSAWLIRRFVDPEAEFFFVSDPDELDDLGLQDAIPFDMRGVEYGHHGQDCTFETILRRHDLVDPVLWHIAAIVHEADLEDDRYDAPEAPGLDVVLRGLAMTQDDDTILSLTGPIFDGLYDLDRRRLLLGTELPG